MGLTTSTLVLFLHISFVIGGLSAAAVLHTSLLLMRSAAEVSGLRPWPRVIATLETLLPASALCILLTGAWLLHLSGGEFGWSDGWVLASVIGLAAVEIAGGALAPRSAALRQAIRDASDGPIHVALQQRVLDRTFWCVLHGGTAVFLAVVFLMVVKPSGAWSAVIVAAVALLGAASGVPFTHPATPTEQVPTRVVDVTEPRQWTSPRS